MKLDEQTSSVGNIERSLMKVKELIKELEVLKPDLEIVIASDGEGNDFYPLTVCGLEMPNDLETDVLVLWP